MPYTIKKARNTEFYKNVQDSDEQKHLKRLEEDKKRHQISGSALDANNPLRDDNGTLISYEDIETIGINGKPVSLEEPWQYVRVPLTQKSSNSRLFYKFIGDRNQFKEFVQNITEEPAPTVSNEELETLRGQLENDIELQQQLNTTLETEIANLQRRIEELND
tara:strand:+ start:4132 stop:4620 length:489 start_codon:yes stop_codon:yes gene_type:complete